MTDHEILDQRPPRTRRRVPVEEGAEPAPKRRQTDATVSTPAAEPSGRAVAPDAVLPSGVVFRGISLADAEAALRSEEASAGPTSRPDCAADLPHIALPAYRSERVGTHSFEYLDHTADIQIHAWGPTLEEAFEGAALGMFNYMTPLEGIEGAEERAFEAEGHDLDTLLYAFLDELLFCFLTDGFVCSRIKIEELDRASHRLRARGWGGVFDRAVHECGTEIKAITYSAMQILDRTPPQDCEVFVIVDI